MIAALRTHLQRLSKDTESGQAMVEFVLVFPVQLLLTLCIIQFAYLAHAHVVVGQAAFQGARAGAVADVGAKTQAEARTQIEDAGNRAAARACALLTSDAEINTPPTAKSTGKTEVKDGRLRWKAQGGSGWYGFSQERQTEAYELLTTSTKHTGGAGRDWIVCEVEYEYMMQIPVANHFLAPFSAKRTAYGGQSYTTFYVHRVGFVPTPWTTTGIED